MWLTVLNWLGANRLLASLIGGVVIAGILGGAYWWITDSAYDRGVAAERAGWEKTRQQAQREAEKRSRDTQDRVERIARERDEARVRAAAAESVIIGKVNYEISKDRVVYGGCRHTPGVRREIGRLLRTVPSAAADGRRGETVPGDAAVP